MRLISILLVFVGLAFANQERVEINFKDLKIDEFVKMVSKISDKNILLTTSIPGKVNFISIKPINKNEIYDLLISVLKTKGFTLIDSGSGFLKIIRSSNAARESPPFKGDSRLNQIQTDIIGIKNLSAAQMLSQVNFLLSKYGKLAVSKEANSLVITDYPSNLKSIRTLVGKLDFQKSMDIEFYTLQNSKVSTILPKIKSIATSVYNQKMPSQKISLFADEGTNSLILISKRKIIDELLLHVEKLDKKDEISLRSLHIVKLKNADAEILAKTLDAIISNKPIIKDKKAKLSSSKKPTFVSDKETNMLMIYASGEEMKEIRTLIESLDAPRQQVYVTAKIVEINDRKSSEIGAKYGIIGGMSSSSGLFTFSGKLGGSPVAMDLNSLGLSVPAVTQAIAIGATISFLESNDAANVLSEPSLLCVNNIESSIYVGETQSIITQGSVATDTTSVERNTFTREDIGLTLKVKPRISSDNKVLLDVEVTIEGVKETLKIGLPTTTKRHIKTTAIVENGESIIIGGLTQKIIKDNESKVPLLGDIPVLGQLFRYDDDDNDKKSLVIILTPYIVNQETGLGNLKETLAKFNKLEADFAKRIGEPKDDN